MNGTNYKYNLIMQFSFSDSSQLQNREIEQVGKTLLPYLEKLQAVSQQNSYDEDESSINLPSDKKTIDEILRLVKKLKTENLKYIIDIGIGGSNLGTKAVYDALFGYFDILNPNRFPKIIFLDTNDPEFTTQVVSLLKTLLSKEEFLINVISKSGTNTEPLANFEVVLSQINTFFQNNANRIVITTDSKSGFYRLAKEMNFSVLSLPEKIGGRYSIFSTVGLFPLATAGISIQELCKGASVMRNLCLSNNLLQNPALVSAVILYLQNKNGKNINDNFFFHSELESIGKWYRQLMGESIGKEHDLNGKTIYAGITPTVSIGSTDLHSMGQLYFGGPRDKITTFVSAPSKKTIGISSSMHFPSLVPHIVGKSLAIIMDAIMQGTMIAYKNSKLPYTYVKLDDLSEHSLGEFLQFKMIEMMFLAKLLNVNAFDQPHVEMYKVETKRILTQ